MFKLYCVFMATGLFLLGCNSVVIETPLAQVEPPLVFAKKKWSWAASLEHSGTIEYSGLNERPPRFSSVWSGSTINQSTAQYAALPYLKIGLGGTLPLIGNFGYLTRLSLGLPFESDFRLGIYAEAISINSKQSSGDQKTTFGAGGYQWKGNGSSTTTREGISLGYALQPNLMLYAGYAKAHSALTVRTEQGVAVDDPGGSFEQSDSLDSAAAGFGLQFGTEHSFFVSGQRIWRSFQTESRHEDVGRTGFELQF